MSQRMHIDRRSPHPSFDVPPQCGGHADRRVVGRIARRWTELRGAATMPAASRYVGMVADGAGGADDGLMLDLSNPAHVTVTRATSALVAVFGVAVGRLTDAGPSSLARAALAAVAAARRHPALVPFEAALSGDGRSSPTLLTRAVLLPLADAGGDLAAAHVVVTWKELLSEQENRRLEHELRLVWTDSVAERAANRAFAERSAR